MKLSQNLKAFYTIFISDLKSTFKRPSAVVMGIIFPLVFIAVFGFMDATGVSFDVAYTEGTNTDNPIYEVLEETEIFQFKEFDTVEDMNYALEKGEIIAIIDIQDTTNYQQQTTAELVMPSYELNVTTSAATVQEGQTVLSVISSITDKLNISFTGVESPPVTLNTQQIAGRKYSQIDYVLPGQLGFSLLSAGVFGTAFLLVNLRETLVLKRFFATPVKPSVFIMGVAMSKLVYSMIQATVIIGVGYFFFDFTLVNGFTTFISMLALSGIGLTVFLGVGLIISSISKDVNTVPPIANLFTIPQFLLAGTFFPIDYFPEWLQVVSKALPLTYLNDAMRKVAFDGDPLTSLKTELLALLIIFVIVYGIAVKVFRYDRG